jgi:hypothetical protein
MGRPSRTAATAWPASCWAMNGSPLGSTQGTSSRPDGAGSGRSPRWLGGFRGGGRFTVGSSLSVVGVRTGSSMGEPACDRPRPRPYGEARQPIQARIVRPRCLEGAPGRAPGSEAGPGVRLASTPPRFLGPGGRRRCRRRRGSIMASLPAPGGRLEPGQELTEQVAELPPPVGREPSPDRRRDRRRWGWGRQARGGVIRRAVAGMGSLRVSRSGGVGTTRPARAARRRRS